MLLDASQNGPHQELFRRGLEVRVHVLQYRAYLEGPGDILSILNSCEVSSNLPAKSPHPPSTSLNHETLNLNPVLCLRTPGKKDKPQYTLTWSLFLGSRNPNDHADLGFNQILGSRPGVCG